MQKLIEDAQAFFDQHQYSAAVDLLSQYLMEFPGHAEAHYWRALARYAPLQYDDDLPLDLAPVKADLASAISAQADHMRARVLRLQILNPHDTQEAPSVVSDANFLIQASVSQEQTLLAYRQLALAHEALGDSAQALSVIQRWHDTIASGPASQTVLSIRTEKDPLYAANLFAKAGFLQRKNQANQALEIYEAALTHAPDSTHILNETGLLAFSEKRFDLAAKCFELATVWRDEDVHAAHAALLQAEIFDQKNHHPALCVAYANIHLDTHYARADLYDMSNPAVFHKCIDLAQKALTFGSNNAAANLIMARAWYYLADLPKSLSYFELTFANGIADIYSQARYMRICIESGLAFPEGFELLHEGTTAYEYYNVGVTVKELIDNKPEAFAAPYLAFAKQSYQRAVALFDGYLLHGHGSAVNNQPHIAAMALNNLANLVFEEENGPEKALPLYERSMKYSVFNENSTMQARCLHLLELHEEAATAYAAVLNLEHDDDWLDEQACYHYGYWGASLLTAARPAQAIAVLEKALRVFIKLTFEPGTPQANGDADHLNMVTQLGDAYAAIGDRQSVNTLYEDAMHRHLGNIHIANNFGLNCQQAGQNDQAMAIYNQAIAACQAAVAAKARDEASDQGDGLNNMYINRGDLYFYQLSNNDAAISDYEAGFKLQGSFALAMRLIAVYYHCKNFKRTEEYADEAEHWYRQKNEDAPEKLALLRTWQTKLAIIRDTPADYLRAMDYAQEAITLDPAQDTPSFQADIARIGHELVPKRKKFLGLF